MKGFRYVIARIDDSEIAGSGLHETVDRLRETAGGARGRRGCCRCCTGLQQQPLPPAAVKLAAKVDAQMSDGLLNVKACRDAGDAEGLVALAATDDMGWTGSPMLLCAAAEGLIAMKKIFRSPPGAGSRRAGLPEGCQTETAPRAGAGAERPDHEGAADPGEAARGRRDWSGNARDPGAHLDGPIWPDGRRSFPAEIARLYRQAFEAFPTDYYTGINAASKSLLAGEKETAAQLAERVQKVVGDKAGTRRLLEDGHGRGSATAAGQYRGSGQALCGGGPDCATRSREP